MKKLLALLFITAVACLVCSIAFAADGINYRDAVVTAKFKKVEVSPAVIETITPGTEETPTVTKEIEPAVYQMELDLPFKVYGEKVMLDGKDITYSYRNDLTLEDKEAMVLVEYRIKDMPGTVIKDETAKVRAYSGFVGESWNQVKAAPVYSKNFKGTKATALSVSDAEGKVTEYKGADAAELVPMYPGMCGAPLKVEAGKEIIEEPIEG